MEQLDQNKKRENLQKEKNQIFRLLPRVDDLMKKGECPEAGRERRI